MDTGSQQLLAMFFGFFTRQRLWMELHSTEHVPHAIANLVTLPCAPFLVAIAVLIVLESSDLPKFALPFSFWCPVTGCKGAEAKPEGADLWQSLG